MNVKEYTEKELIKINTYIGSLPVTRTLEKVQEWQITRIFPSHIKPILKNLIKKLIKNFKIKEVHLFGSYFEGHWYDSFATEEDLKFRKMMFNSFKAETFSDIDLMIDLVDDKYYNAVKLFAIENNLTINSIIPKNSILLYKNGTYYI